MPGENGVAQPLEGDNYTLLLAGLFAEIVRIVRLIYSKRQRHIREDLIEELSRQIILLLLEDNCRRLRTFDCRKSSFSTWLNRVIEHHVSHYLQKQKPDESLDDPVLDKLISPPDQEMKLITEEQRKILWIAIDALPSRQKQLISLVLEEVPNDEIARRMNLKLESVHRSKHEIIRKLQQITKNGGGKRRARNSSR
ncbi:MAG: sigma-70 family RNA polymerase sigma factor [Blastocatellia bacterium]